MIKIFDSKERVFTTNGIINIKPISCKETKKKSLNGWYLNLEIDVKYKEYIKKDMLVVIKSKSKLSPQAFRMEEPKFNNNIIEIVANHVMFDADRYMLYDVRPTDKNALNALEYIDNRIENDTSPFVYYSDVPGIHTAYFQLKNLLEAWQIIEERWGGVFDADNWKITLSASLGKNVGQMLVYGKNIKNFAKYEDWSNVVTRIFPVGRDGVKLPEKYIDADVQYDMPYSKKIELDSDLEFEDREPTEEELVNELRIKALQYLEENKYPRVSYEISSNINESFDVNDKIIVKHPLADLNTEVQEYTYNHVDKYTENLVFGNYTRDVKERFQNIRESITNVLNHVSNNEWLIRHQTDLINSLNKDGLVYIDKNEVLVLDKLPKEEAKYVWRIGLGGFAFSENGYEGPFKTAWTQDGMINADFIRTGKLSTDIIEGYEDLLLTVKKLNSEAETISKIEINLEQIKQSIGSITNTTVSSEGTGTISIADILASEILYLHVRPTSEDLSYSYLKKDKYLEKNSYLLSRDIIFKHETDSTKDVRFTLPCDLLYLNIDVYDEFILNYENKEIYVIHRVGLNSDGNKYALTKATTEYFDYKGIELEGNYTIKMLSFNSSYIRIRALAKNLNTSQNVTRVEFNSSITQIKNSITAEVNGKLTLVNGDIDTLSARLKLTSESITSEVTRAKNAESSLGTRITQTAESITSEVTRAKNEESKITQKFDNISLSVANGSASATLTLKVDGKEKNVTINMTGLVKFEDLSKNGSTTINGSNIATGTIDASKVTVKNLNASNITTGILSCDRLFGGTIKGQTISGGTISGSKITCSNGTIGGWTISSTTISQSHKASDGKTYEVILANYNNDNVGSRIFHCSVDGTDTFYIHRDGKMYCSNATIAGTISGSTISGSTMSGGTISGSKITCTNGTIGGWSVASNYLYATDSSGYSVRLTPENLMAKAPGDTWEYARWYDLTFDYSDKRIKNSINSISDEYENFFNNLNPSSFKFNKAVRPDDYEKLHFGFIAQDILENEEKNNLKDLAMVSGTTRYRLDKEEIIALNTWQIQKLKQTIEEIKKKVGII